jgi:hypothetical protein
MWIKDIFKKRKPNHLIIYVTYDKKEIRLYNFYSKFTHSIGPTGDLDIVITQIRDFIKKHPSKLDQINLTSYGQGTKLLQSKYDNEKLKEVLDELKPIMSDKCKIMFTTCFSGVSYRKVVEMSEYLNGVEVCAIKGHYTHNVKMTRCKCKKVGYSEKIMSELDQSRYGLYHDEKQINFLVRRDEGEEITWKTAGMAYQYNEKVTNDGICVEGNQPYTLLKCVRNYLFNIQS